MASLRKVMLDFLSTGTSYPIGWQSCLRKGQWWLLTCPLDLLWNWTSSVSHNQVFSLVLTAPHPELHCDRVSRSRALLSLDWGTDQEAVTGNPATTRGDLRPPCLGGKSVCILLMSRVQASPSISPRDPPTRHGRSYVFFK